MKLVPVELFSLLALVTGATDEVPPSDIFVEVTDEAKVKLLSICMDIIYLSSNGRTQTPKSLAPGLTLRHLTGSTTVSNLLHKFGHCASYDSIVRYETGLATRQIEMNKTAPKGFCPKVFTVAVWDNIDLDEETVSGSGTTHHTNGILVQPSVSEFDQQACSLSLKKSQRKLQSPHLFILIDLHPEKVLKLCHQTCVLVPLQSTQNELLLIKGKISDSYS